MTQDESLDAAWHRRMQVVRMHQAGMLYREIAKMWGVTKSRISTMAIIGRSEIRLGLTEPPSYRINVRAEIERWDAMRRPTRRWKWPQQSHRRACG